MVTVTCFVVTIAFIGPVLTRPHLNMLLSQFPNGRTNFMMNNNPQSLLATNVANLNNILTGLPNQQLYQNNWNTYPNQYLNNFGTNFNRPGGVFSNGFSGNFVQNPTQQIIQNLLSSIGTVYGVNQQPFYKNPTKPAFEPGLMNEGQTGLSQGQGPVSQVPQANFPDKWNASHHQSPASADKAEPDPASHNEDTNSDDVVFDIDVRVGDDKQTNSSN